MTPTEITALASRHLDGWLNSTEGPCLRERVAAAIAEALKLRDKLWQNGNATLRHERDTALEQLRNETELASRKLAGIRAALNMDLYPGEDEETVARRVYHEGVNLRFAAERWKGLAEKATKELTDYKAMMHEKGP